MSSDIWRKLFCITNTEIQIDGITLFTCQFHPWLPLLQQRTIRKLPKTTQVVLNIFPSARATMATVPSMADVTV